MEPTQPLTNLRTGSTVAARVRRAVTLRDRTVGLLGRDGLEDGEGLWLEPCGSIHMFFMRFAIDAAFLDRRGAVVRIVERLRPGRVAFGGLRARAVVELAAGTLAASGTRVGDELRLG